MRFLNRRDGVWSTLDLNGNIMNEWITVDPKICGGKPVIRGTRIMVKNILGMVAGGYTVNRIIAP